jgi:hypothetical protein
MKCAPEGGYRVTAYTLANATINFSEKLFGKIKAN